MFLSILRGRRRSHATTDEVLTSLLQESIEESRKLRPLFNVEKVREVIRQAQTPTDCVGKIVFIEAHGKEYFDHREIDASTYHNGEWLCLRQTPSAIYGCKVAPIACQENPDDDYGCHQVHVFETDRTRKKWYTVEVVCRDDDAIRRTIRTLSKFIKRDGKKDWINSVYATAADTLQLLQRLCPNVREIKDVLDADQVRVGMLVTPIGEGAIYGGAIHRIEVIDFPHAHVTRWGGAGYQESRTVDLTREKFKLCTPEFVRKYSDGGSDGC